MTYINAYEKFILLAVQSIKDRLELLNERNDEHIQACYHLIEALKGMVKTYQTVRGIPPEATVAQLEGIIKALELMREDMEGSKLPTASDNNKPT